MKKIIIAIILSILFTFNLEAQKLYKPNTVYLALQPVDWGIGVRYDRMFNPFWGSYISLTHGRFELETGELIEHHYKVASGVLLYFTPKDRFYQTYLGAGISFNTYNGLYNITPMFPENAIYQWSFELLCNARLSKNFNMGLRLDPIKWESSIDFGFSF